MSDVAIGFYGIKEIFRGLAVPELEGLLFRQLVKSIVDFDGVEILSVVLEPFAFRELVGIIWTFPVGVMPAGSANSDITFCFGHKKYFNILNNL